MTPEVQDYERVIFYASRIRELNVGHKDDRIEQVVYSALLSKQSIIGPLFPKLQRLTIDLEAFEGQAIYARLVVGPNVRVLNIHDSGDDETETHWNNAVAVLAPSVPHLQYFQIGMDEDWNLRCFSPAGVNALCRSFHSLETLRIRNLTITCDALAHIATMPKLNLFQFGIESDQLRAFCVTPTLPEEFSKIRSLEIYTETLPPCPEFLSRSAFSHLERLAIVQCEEGGDWELGPLIEMLRMPNLQSLKIWKSEEQELPHTPFTRSMLSNLFRLSKLTHLDITLNLSLQLHDADLKGIPAAWPNLTHFSLMDHAVETTPNLTFEGFLDLTKTCQDLRTLVLRVDARNIDKFFISGPYHSSNLHTLNLCTSPLSQANDLYKIIPLVFSHLQTLDVSEVYKCRSADSHDVWKMVVSSLRPLVPSPNVEFT